MLRLPYGLDIRETCDLALGELREVHIRNSLCELLAVILGLLLGITGMVGHAGLGVE